MHISQCGLAITNETTAASTYTLATTHTQFMFDEYDVPQAV